MKKNLQSRALNRLLGIKISSVEKTYRLILPNILVLPNGFLYIVIKKLSTK